MGLGRMLNPGPLIEVTRAYGKLEEIPINVLREKLLYVCIFRKRYVWPAVDGEAEKILGARVAAVDGISLKDRAIPVAEME